MTATIRVGAATCGLAAGAEATADAIGRFLVDRGIDARLERVGCLGACHREPLVEILRNGTSTLLGPLTAEGVPGAFDVLFRGRPVDGVADAIVSRRQDRADYPFLGRQRKVSTRLCGAIDPESLDAFLANDGYRALRAALAMEPEAIVAAVRDAHLRGRGGAGFPTATKWDMARRSPGQPKYLVCNADEGDPGAFMDRAIIEGDPHRILEGMLIAGRAIGASTGYIYVRAEYPLAVRRLRNAIEQADRHGVVGRNILGSDFDFSFVIKEGAGAFVCGEETALMRSIEGYRGTPSMRPPYPTARGLWGHPTTINNVETLALVPSILLNGPAWFAAMGTERSGGTKAFALSGSIARPGLVEVPIGIPLRELLYDIGGGGRDGRDLKAVQLGGPSGGCVPAALFDTRVDYEDLRQTGAIMGSGGMVAVDESACMVDLARFFLRFTQEESCGKCVPCRIGTRKMLSIVSRVSAGQASLDDIARLESLCATVRDGSLCGLGQTAPNPVLTTLRYYRDEYEAHIRDRTCRTGSCRIGEPVVAGR
ncbi:MAG: NADH-quinone oxidoreductase subunit F [Chloroflexota bacterium]|nr:MAG: NADH-quinone oxidoreductase subunit F [Chloroflexota bacterium]